MFGDRKTVMGREPVAPRLERCGFIMQTYRESYSPHFPRATHSKRDDKSAPPLDIERATRYVVDRSSSTRHVDTSHDIVRYAFPKQQEEKESKPYRLYSIASFAREQSNANHFARDKTRCYEVTREKIRSESPDVPARYRAARPLTIAVIIQATIIVTL